MAGPTFKEQLLAFYKECYYYEMEALLHEDLVGRVGLFGLWFTLCWGSDTTRV